jgi:long-chain acyl-CoA synthetase
VYRRMRGALGGRMEYAISGGAPLNEGLNHFFNGAGITVFDGYGLTEAAGAVAVNTAAASVMGTVGRPLPGVTVRIAGDGEILVKGRNVFAGYWHDTDATSAALDADGWLHTGDTGTVDSAGFLRIVGRKKDLIVTAGGINVAPAPLEDRVREHPLVSQCVVVGDRRPYVACLITVDAEALGQWQRQHNRPPGAGGGDLTADQELQAEIKRGVDRANAGVSRAESIRRFRILPADFTEAAGQLTPSGKVRRSVVATEFAADIEALYA